MFRGLELRGLGVRVKWGFLWLKACGQLRRTMPLKPEALSPAAQIKE